MFTDAEQTNRNIVDGESARMITAPQLEIYCDEVKCSHGATTRTARRAGNVLYAGARYSSRRSAVCSRRLLWSM